MSGQPCTSPGVPEDTVLDYRFNHPALLVRALTHRSAGQGHNERFEYLGDALLAFLVADVLYARFPEAEEGELTQRRTTLVCRATLAELACEHGLDARVQSSVSRPLPDRLLADAVEALIAAVYLDSDLDTCRRWVLRLYDGRLAASANEMPRKDTKMELQEYLQTRHLPVPVYCTLDRRGRSHAPEFLVCCKLEALGMQVRASGSSIRRAEQEAARQLLHELGAVSRERLPPGADAW